MDQNSCATINRFDQNNNVTQINLCSCTKISIMQLFHEMKQEFPKVPDHVIQKLVTDNCHNRQACLDQMHTIASLSKQTAMYPSKSIHNNNNNYNNSNSTNNANQTVLSSSINGTKKWLNSQKMKEISEKFENTPINCPAETRSKSNAAKCEKKRPTVLPLRRAPDPPATIKTSPTSDLALSMSKNISISSSSNLSHATSTTSISSISSSQEQVEQQEVHHNVTLDSAATKINDSLNVQLNLTVSPIVSDTIKKVAPPPPPSRHLSHLSVQPEAPFSSLLESGKTSIHGPVGALIGSCGQRSFTKLNFTLRPPSSIMPSPNTPIEIHAGPQSLTYASTSFNAEQGYQRQLKITVADNTDGSSHTTRTFQKLNRKIPEINQIDTTVKIEGNCLDKRKEINPIRITSDPFKKTLQNEEILNGDLRQHVLKQLRQKQSLELELEKEREKLQMIIIDIKTLTSSVLTKTEFENLFDEITQLRKDCSHLSNHIDVIKAPHASHVTPNQNRPPPPMPRSFVRLSSPRSPSSAHLLQLDTTGLRYPSAQPPSYNEVMQDSSDATSNNNLNNPNLSEGQMEKWICNKCTFLNNELMLICEICGMSRVQGISNSNNNNDNNQNGNITITSSSYSPLQNNQLHATVPTNENFMQTSVL